MAYRVSKQRFGELVERVLEELPVNFALVLENISVEIRDRPSTAQRQKQGLGPRDLLLGLYSGVSRPNRSVEHSGVLPDVIYIFQNEIEDTCGSERQLSEQVRITVLHEIGHHFGLDEVDLDELGFG